MLQAPAAEQQEPTSVLFWQGGVTLQAPEVMPIPTPRNVLVWNWPLRVLQPAAVVTVQVAVAEQHAPMIDVPESVVQ